MHNQYSKELKNIESTDIIVTKGRFLAVNRKKILLSSTIIIMILIILLFTVGFALIINYNGKIVLGMTVSGIDISGLSIEEAIQTVSEQLNSELERKIVVKSGEIEKSIALNQIDASYNIEETIKEAYKVGRDGNIVENNIEIMKVFVKRKNNELVLKYDEELVKQIVTDINSKLPDVSEPRYRIENNNLIIRNGIKGAYIEIEEAINLIRDEIENSSGIPIELNLIDVHPEEINIELIYNAIYREPKDADTVLNSSEIIEHVNGIEFNMEEAILMLEEEQEEYVIQLISKEPEMTTQKLKAQIEEQERIRRAAESVNNGLVVIGSFYTQYNAGDTGRTKNLQLASNKINEVVVMPGETFSFNEVVGRRTREAGYQDAPGFANGKVVPMLGGGICQISSTLYNSVVYANLEIVERKPHMFVPSYVGPGRDATLFYGSIDFKFRNTRNHPITIKSSVGGGTHRVDILGTRERNEYEIEISTTILSSGNGTTSRTYKILKQNGVEISRVVLSNDRYDAMR